MNITRPIALAGLVAATLFFVRPSAVAADGSASPAAPSGVNASANAKTADAAQRFGLDFKGGSVHQLVDAISAARGKLLNVYIPAEAQGITLPAIKAQDTDAASLLRALSNGQHIDGRDGTSMLYSFESVPTKETEFWFVNLQPDFRANGMVPPQQTNRELQSRVYLLTPYLDAGISVDDITTAIRTAWKMFDRENTKANLSYHRETKLLIAVAPNEELFAIDQVLAALQQGIHPKKTVAPAAAPVPATEKAASTKS